MISRLEIENFAAFRELKLDFSPRINVIIGENSCGKTQLLKAIYALTSTTEDINQRLIRLFKPRKSRLSSLYCNGGDGVARISVGDASGNSTSIEFKQRSKKILSAPVFQDDNGILIPSKELLSLLPAIHDQIVNDDVLSALFDDSVIDLCNKLLEEPKKETQKLINSDPRLASIVPMLVEAINGKFILDGADHYFSGGTYKEKTDSKVSSSKHAQIYRDNTFLDFEKAKGSEASVTMTAEGYRKIGLLQRLIENGSLGQGQASVLLWDEPESNMNPSLIKMLVQCILELSRNGQQIIIATHHYVLLKWFDLLMDKDQSDHITYHALYRNEEGIIANESHDDYKMLAANAIAKTYSDLYDAEIERSLGGAK